MPFWKAPQPGIHNRSQSRFSFYRKNRKVQAEVIITFHVDDIPGLVVGEVSGQMLHSLLLVAPGEHVSGATTVSGRVAHLEVCLLSEIIDIG